MTFVDYYEHPPFTGLTSPMASSSLSNVVSSLVRGSPNSSTVTDEDLDRHIGEIILREAKAKAERYKKEGIKAYLPP